MDRAPQFKPQLSGFATKAIHSGQNPNQWLCRSVQPPIFTSTVFEQTQISKKLGESEYYYSRMGNPTRDVLEKCLADLDNGKFCKTYSSGIGAIMAAFSLLESGDHIISSYDIYGGTSDLLQKHSAKYNIEIDFVHIETLHDIKALVKHNTKMVYIESPSNPMMKVIDVGALSTMLKTRINRKILLVIDNTFLTSYFQRPLELGADISLYSITKFMNGHSDVTMGAALTNCPKLNEKLEYAQKTCGNIPSPIDCHQVIRSLKTLALRMERHSSNCLAIAKFLEINPYIEQVLHPGLTSHPQHEIALKQSYGHSGILSFYIKGAGQHAMQLIKSLTLIRYATSLGGIETFITLPMFASHVSIAPNIQKKLGITDNLVRLSVGIEDVEMIIADLDQALKKVFENRWKI